MTQVQHWAKAAQTDHVTLRPSKFGHARPLGSRIIRYVRVGRTDGRTDRRTDGQKQRLFPLPYGGGIEISLTASVAQKLPIQKYPLFECTTWNYKLTRTPATLNHAPPMRHAQCIEMQPLYVSKNPGCHTQIYPWLTYLLECCCVYLVHPKVDLYIFSNKSRQNSLLAVPVRWVSVNVNMFAISYLSHLHIYWTGLKK